MDDLTILAPDHLGKLLETDDQAVLSEFYTLFCTQIETMLENDSVNSKQDVDSLHKDAHRMVSSCNTVGAFRLAALFSDLEAACQADTKSRSIEALKAQIRALMEETLSTVKTLEKSNQNITHSPRSK
jgi:HPt (histidine-containing phosphotransfer) domain-containing protein